MSNRWFEDNDPYSKEGVARVIVVRTKQEHNWRGELDNCIRIMHVESFAYGFLCKDITKSKRGNNSPIRWINDAISDDTEHKINHLFKTLPIGIYELIGEVWSWSSVSWEGEWDGDTELRNTKIQEISFDHAVSVGGDSWFDNMVELIPHSESRDQYYNDDTDINPYMSHVQILRAHANALSKLLDTGYFSSRPNYNDMTVKELENCIYLLMMQIDSEKPIMQPKSLEIDAKVDSVIKDHRAWMDPEF